MRIGGYDIDTVTKKKDSVNWQNAKKIARCKGCNFTPVAIHVSGTVIVMSLIRGNYWLI